MTTLRLKINKSRSNDSNTSNPSNDSNDSVPSAPSTKLKLRLHTDKSDKSDKSDKRNSSSSDSDFKMTGDDYSGYDNQLDHIYNITDMYIGSDEQMERTERGLDLNDRIFVD